MNHPSTASTTTPDTQQPQGEARVTNRTAARDHRGRDQKPVRDRLVNRQPDPYPDDGATVIPAHNLEAEQATLGGMLLSADVAGKVTAILGPGDFYQPRHATIFKAIVELHGRDEPTDPIAVAAHLAAVGDLGRVGGAPYLHTLMAAIPTPANATYYAKLVADQARLRLVGEVGARFAAISRQADPSSIDDLLDWARSQLDRAATPTVTDVPGEEVPPSWAPVDLSDILAGTYVPETPALMPRTDGQHLLYAGRLHSMHGESESGKSLIIQAECARVLLAGGRVLYIDYESDAQPLTGRLIELGVPNEVIDERFHYVHPECSPFSSAAEQEAWMSLLGASYDLAVIDGVTDALGTNNVKTNDNDEIATWCRRIARPIAKKTGAAVVLIDHVIKDEERRGRYALGGQAKMNALDGAAYVVEVVEALGQGLVGTVALRVAKDRPGGVRGHCGTFRKGDRTQEAARIVVDSRLPQQIRVTVEPPTTGATPTEPAKFRPTHIMEKVSKYLEENPNPEEPNSLRRMRDVIPAKAVFVDTALICLRDEGYVTETKGKQNARIFTHIKPYSEFADPLSDKYAGPRSQTVSQPRPDRVPDTVESPRPDRVPTPAPPTGRDTVDGTHSGSIADDVVPPPAGHGWAPEETCPRCGWHTNSAGHFMNCGDEE